MTKLLILTLLAAFISAHADNIEKIIAATTECKNQTLVTEEMIRSHKPGDGKPSEELLCFIKCTFEGLGYIHPDGTLGVDEMKRDEVAGEGDDEDLEKIYNCLDGLQGVKECDDAWALEQCFNIE